ncbi:hypothetical protein FD754_016068 [Muntiacus muntjak]|uniref:Uncharacterized protein n=1 Tax=Muntiacus muntjak TaxID=9888 RepID=A0A5N3VPN7_MUNMU|nr:hypothetical protein FD754_016068 [Muntiacus muntjak]
MAQQTTSPDTLAVPEVDNPHCPNPWLNEDLVNSLRENLLQHEKSKTSRKSVSPKLSPVISPRNSPRLLRRMLLSSNIPKQRRFTKKNSVLVEKLNDFYTAFPQNTNKYHNFCQSFIVVSPPDEGDSIDWEVLAYIQLKSPSLIHPQCNLGSISELGRSPGEGKGCPFHFSWMGQSFK